MTAPALAQYVQGLATVSGDNLNTFEQTCDTFADMRAFVGTVGLQLFTRGGTAILDGLQGIFYWNADSSADDDNLNIIVPTAAPVTGRWIRIPVTAVGNSFVTAKGYRLALEQDGVLQAVLDALPSDPTTAVRIYWDSAATVSVDDPVWNFVQTVTGFTDIQMSALYILALALSA